MELTRHLLGIGFRRPRVLLVPAPGAAGVRMHTEGWLTASGWPRATSPADADVLLVTGRPGPELAERIERVWQQLPGPRARTEANAAIEVEPRLLAARDSLLDLAAQRQDAAQRAPQELSDPDPDPDSGDMDMDMESDSDDMGGMDSHDMGGMEMPGGLGMAEPGDDRDGLGLDALHVEAGPVLPHWPAGLVAELTLQGDVVTQARLRYLDHAGGNTGGNAEGNAGPAEDLAPQLLALDRAVAVLRLAGSRWAAPAQALRQRGLAGAELDTSQLRRTIGRDRVLRWSLRQLPAAGTGDLWQALLSAVAPGSERPAQASVAELGETLVGLDLAGVRLAVAAAPPTRAPAREPVDA